MKKLRGKTAVITGAASGIGRSCAKQFAAAGMDVVVADLDDEGMQQTVDAVESRGRKAWAVKTDVTSTEQVQALYEQTLSHAGGVHVVMNNAGIARFDAALDLTDEDWHKVIDVNMWGVIHGCRIFGRHLRAQGEGHIVNTASLNGLVGMPGCASYVASKFAVVGLSENLRYELAADGVGVTVVCPGMVRTQIGASSGDADVERVLAEHGSDVDRLGKLVVKAVRRDRGRLLYGPEPKVATFLRRFAPWLLELLGKSLAKGRRQAKAGALPAGTESWRP